jgi:hypothetical protein
MSTKELAINVINNLPEEKLRAFLVLFADDNTLARMESDLITTDPERKKYNSFSEIMAEIDNEDD